jgi:hypothetical protein
LCMYVCVVFILKKQRDIVVVVVVEI